MLPHPLSLQARLMAAVIGFVSLILVIVAIITSATLGKTLEDGLQEQLDATSNVTTALVTDRAQRAALRGEVLTAETAIQGGIVSDGSLLVAVLPPSAAASGVIATPDEASLPPICSPSPRRCMTRNPRPSSCPTSARTA